MTDNVKLKILARAATAVGMLMIKTKQTSDLSEYVSLIKNTPEELDWINVRNRVHVECLSILSWMELLGSGTQDDWEDFLTHLEVMEKNLTHANWGDE